MRNRFHPDNPNGCDMTKAMPILAATIAAAALTAAGLVVLVMAVINTQDDYTDIDEQDD
ncbi:hypothetical protein CLV29_2537 [Naumannella halotolerans]|uniref:Uncharacterized protein n=1 Tax=Naumannella halotolerans TaxID=993414 RepID=A0A4R7J233_9ACTN|nr:hypothetical protein CLV29_2537 [Naumannella halotolerans]